jgi:hypothetical protein
MTNVQEMTKNNGVALKDITDLLFIISSRKSDRMDLWVLETEKSDLISQLSVAWSIGDLDEYIDDKGNAVIDSVKIERRSRTTWGYSPAVKALQEKEQHTGAAERKVTTYICVTDVKKK